MMIYCDDPPPPFETSNVSVNRSLQKLYDCFKKGIITEEQLEKEVDEQYGRLELHGEVIQNATKISLTPKTLRDYQVQAIKQVAYKRSEGHKSLVIHLPTGSGKTLIAAAIVKSFYLANLNILFVVNRNELVRQTQVALEECGLANVIGFIKSGMTESPSQPIQIASIQTLRNRTAPSADLVVLDEAHHCVSPSYEKLLTSYRSSTIIGLTATPFRTRTSETLLKVFDCVIPGVSVGDLIAAKVLVPPVTFSPPKDALRNLFSNNNNSEFRMRDCSRVMDSEKRIAHAVREWESHCHNRRTIAFCVNLKHAQNVTAAFKKKRISAEIIDGDTSSKVRASLFKRLVLKEVMILVSVGVLSEGFDEPSIEALLLLRPTNSKTLFIQQVGRGLRSAPHKSNCIVIDCAGNTWRHGCVTNPPAEASSSLASEEARDAPVKRCECGHMLHIAYKTCPNCSHIFSSLSSEKENDDENILSLLTTGMSQLNVGASTPPVVPFWLKGDVAMENFKRLCEKHQIPEFDPNDSKLDTRDQRFLKKIMGYMKRGHQLSSNDVRIIRKILQK